MNKPKNIEFFNRDIWYIDAFNHKRNNNTLKKLSINFNSIPSNLKLLTKIYIYSNLQKHTFSTVKSKLRYITPFMIFINNEEPEWTELTHLNKDIILKFIEELNAKNVEYKTTNLKILNQVKVLILYLQQYYPNFISSTIDIEEIMRGCSRRYLIENKKTSTDDKFISSNVIKQFDEKIINLERKSDFIIASIMRQVGLRCNEIFNLKYDQCIVKKNDIYYILIKQVSKTRILDKLLPIKLELAVKILELNEEVKQISEDNNINKEKYLFVHTSGAKIGKRISPRSFINRLNKFAVKNEIKDDNGEIFVFKSHSFRHTRGTELLNQGMAIENIQSWLSHLNKDMTLNYAIPLNCMIDSECKKIKTSSLEENLQCRIVDDNYIEQLNLNNRISKIKKRLGYCIKPAKLNCKYINNICNGCDNIETIK